MHLASNGVNGYAESHLFQIIKVIRVDALAPVQTMVQRCTFQMKMINFMNYFMNLNGSSQEIVFSLPEV